MYLLKVRLLRCIKLHSEMATELCQYIHVMRYDLLWIYSKDYLWKSRTVFVYI